MITRAKLFERAGMTADDLPQTEEEAFAARDEAIAAVAEVRQQLADERAGLTSRSVDDHTWPYRTQRALHHMQAKANLLKRHARDLRAARHQREAAQKKQAKREAQETQIAQAQQAARRAEIRAKAHVALQESEAIATLRALRDHIKTLPEAERQQFYDVMSAAQAEFMEGQN